MAMIRREVRRDESFCGSVGMLQTSATTARSAARKHGVRCASLTAAVVVQQIDQCVVERLERIVYLTNRFKAKLQTPKLVLPCEHSLDRTKAPLVDRCVEVPPVAARGCFTVPPAFGNTGTHVPVGGDIVKLSADERSKTNNKDT